MYISFILNQVKPHSSPWFSAACAAAILLSLLFILCFIILELSKVKIENCLFINKYSNNKLPYIFTNWFTFSSMSHNYQTLFALLKRIFKSLVSKQPYGKNAFVYMVIKIWNDIQKEMKSVMLNTFSLVKLKSLLIEFT